MEPGRKKIPIPRISSTINRIDLTKTSGDGERLQRPNNEAKESMPRCLHACTPCRTSKLKVHNTFLSDLRLLSVASVMAGCLVIPAEWDGRSQGVPMVQSHEGLSQRNLHQS